MKEKWEDLELETIPFKKTQYVLVSNFEELEQELDDDFCILESMIVNPFRGPFEEEIEEWNQELLQVSNIIEEW